MFFENVRDAEIQLTKDTLQEIQRMKASGMSPEKIANSLISGDGFEKSFLNDAGQELWKAMKSISQNSVYDSMGDNLYRWECNPGAKHCEVCLKLNGKEKPFEVWQAEGTPGQRNEGCHFNCMCDLVPVEKKSVTTENSKATPDVPKTNLTVNNNQNIPLLNDKECLKLLKEDYPEISFSGIKLLDEQGKTDFVSTLNSVKKVYGNNVFDGLKSVSVTNLDDVYGGAAGVYFKKTKSIELNAKYFEPKQRDELVKELQAKIDRLLDRKSKGKSVFESDINDAKKAIEEITSKDFLKQVLAHEMGHHALFLLDKIAEDMVRRFYNKNIEAVEKYYEFYNFPYGHSDLYEFYAETSARYALGYFNNIPNDIKEEAELIRGFMQESIKIIKKVKKVK